MSKKPTILIVDDEISNIEIMNEALGDEYEICFATSGEQALELIKTSMPELVLLDVVLPGMQGFDVCRAMKRSPVLADIPVIFTTGLNDHEDELYGLSLGAIDYVTKPIHPLILRNRVRNNVELKLLRDQLAEMAVTDALTGLHNRRKLDGLLNETVEKLSESGDWLSLLMLDIDFFKQFNDAYGHQQGDTCINLVAAALNRAVARYEGHTARYGGEEFSCILPRCDAECARWVACEIRAQIEELGIPHERSSVARTVTLSIGIATARARPGLPPTAWTKAADERLYKAKTSGRNRVELTVFDAEVAQEVETPAAKSCPDTG